MSDPFLPGAASPPPPSPDPLHKAMRAMDAAESAEQAMTERHRDEMKRISDGMNGVTLRFNENQKYSLEVAKVHALISIAASLNHIAGIEPSQLLGLAAAAHFTNVVSRDAAKGGA